MGRDFWSAYRREDSQRSGGSMEAAKIRGVVLGLSPARCIGVGSALELEHADSSARQNYRIQSPTQAKQWILQQHAPIQPCGVFLRNPFESCFQRTDCEEPRTRLLRSSLVAGRLR